MFTLMRELTVFHSELLISFQVSEHEPQPAAWPAPEWVHWNGDPWIPGLEPQRPQDSGQAGLREHALAIWPPGPVTNSIFSICKTLLIFLECKSMNPLLRKIWVAFVPPSHSLISVSDPWRAFWAEMAPFGPSPCLMHCFWNFRDTRTLSSVPHLAQRSQDTVKNSWRKPWLWVWWKRTFLHQSLIVKIQ